MPKAVRIPITTTPDALALLDACEARGELATPALLEALDSLRAAHGLPRPAGRLSLESIVVFFMLAGATPACYAITSNFAAACVRPL
jgi:hypothetical protein